MYKTFKLTAVAAVLREDDFRGCLKTITFIAASESETHRWWSVNTGCMAKDFEQYGREEL